MFYIPVKTLLDIVNNQKNFRNNSFRISTFGFCKTLSRELLESHKDDYIISCESEDCEAEFREKYPYVRMINHYGFVNEDILALMKLSLSCSIEMAPIKIFKTIEEYNNIEDIIELKVILGIKKC